MSKFSLSIIFLLLIAVCGCQNQKIPSGDTTTRLVKNDSNIVLETITASNPSINNKPPSPEINENDTINYEEDIDYGIGDDDLFQADDFKIIKTTGDTIGSEINKLNDYNLATFYKSNFVTGKNDTLLLIVSFPGLRRGLNRDTTIVIDEISFFNGNRHSKKEWEMSGKVKAISILNNHQLIGDFKLADTYKYQSIWLNSRSIANIRGTTDTIAIVIKDIYPGIGKEADSYSLSEIKFGGIKKY